MYSTFRYPLTSILNTAMNLLFLQRRKYLPTLGIINLSRSSLLHILWALSLLASLSNPAGEGSPNYSCLIFKPPLNFYSPDVFTFLPLRSIYLALGV